jgi:hypothetical protein
MRFFEMLLYILYIPVINKFTRVFFLYAYIAKVLPLFLTVSLGAGATRSRIVSFAGA